MKEAKMRELIYLARCGEGEAYDALYHLYLKLAVKISYELLDTCPNANFDVPELAHCADERFTRVLKSYDERFYSSPGSYFYLCIKRFLIRILKKNRVITTISLDEPIADRSRLADIVADPTPKYDPLAQQDRQIKYEIIRKDVALVDSVRDVTIFCCYMEGYTAQEIADIVKAPDVRTVYNVIYRTIDRLKAQNIGRRKARENLKKGLYTD